MLMPEAVISSLIINVPLARRESPSRPKPNWYGPPEGEAVQLSEVVSQSPPALTGVCPAPESK